MGDKLQPAFWGGLFIGVLSALPLVQVGNCCCCLWVVAGGVLAAYLRQQQSPYAIPASEGALVGLMAGVIGGVVTAVLSIPMQAISGPMQQRIVDWVVANNAELPAELRDMIERAAADAAGFHPVRFILNLVYLIVVGLVFGLLGGLLGVAIFKKNELPPPPPPPPPPPGTVEVLPPQV